MSQKISISPYQKRFKITLDDGTQFLLYSSEVKKYHLSDAENVDENTLTEIMQLLYRRAKERALYLLDRSLWTEWQIREKLKAGLYPSQIIDQVISYLKEYHLVDDYQYAQLYIDYRKCKKSRQQIVRDLLTKGISRGLIEQVLEDVGFTNRDSLSYFVQKGKQRYQLSDQKEYQKFMRYLFSKGYHYDEVREAVKAMTDFDV